MPKDCFTALREPEFQFFRTFSDLFCAPCSLSAHGAKIINVFSKYVVNDVTKKFDVKNCQ